MSPWFVLGIFLGSVVGTVGTRMALDWWEDRRIRKARREMWEQ